MSKAPTTRADMLRMQRETRYGHLQATVDPPKDRYVDGAGRVRDTKPAKLEKARKLIPYAGKESKGIAPKPTGKNPGRKRITRKDR